MKKIILMLLLLVSLALFGCEDKAEVPEVPNGATTIEGVYIAEDIGVCYYFSKDGFGFQYIGGQPFQIRYYIKDGSIHIENFSVEGGLSADFTFEQYDGYILINNIKYELSDGGDVSLPQTEV